MDKVEQRGIRISLLGSLLFSLLGVSFAVITRSQAVLLDGAFDLVAVVMVFFSLKVSQLLHRPLSEQRPFGYVAFEPFYILLKGLTLLVLTVVVMISNLIILVKGGNELELNWVIGYVVLAVIGNFLVYGLLHRQCSKSASPIIELEKENWLVNALISTGIGVAFVLVMLFKNSVLKGIVPYIDQIVVIGVSLVSLPIPMKAIKNGLRELLLFAPDSKLTQPLNAQINACLPKQAILQNKNYMVKTGRKLWITVVAQVKKRQVSSGLADACVEEISKVLQPRFPHHHVDVVLTEKEL